MRSAIGVGLAVLLLACGRERQAEPPPPPPAPKAVAPTRGAAGDRDLRVMLAELASAKACEMIRGQFRGLRAPDRPELVTGVLWIRGCKIENDDTRVTFRLTGNGWQWAEETKHQAGGEFAVRQYVRFAVDATIPGALDVAYARDRHVVSLWFTPEHIDVKFTPVGGVSVDEKGLWSSVIGTMGEVFASSPDEKAEEQAKSEGTRQFKNELADGLSVTVQLCSGLVRFNLGRPPKGEMVAPDVGETHKVPVELQPGGVMIFGPHLVGHKLTADVDTRGPVRVALACHDQAEAAAAAFLEGREPAVRVLASAVVNGHGRLRIPRQECPVSLIARAVAGPATFDWRRPPAESARSTGGPLIDCGK
jgi:hypothetical protein